MTKPIKQLSFNFGTPKSVGKSDAAKEASKAPKKKLSKKGVSSYLKGRSTSSSLGDIKKKLKGSSSKSEKAKFKSLIKNLIDNSGDKTSSNRYVFIRALKDGQKLRSQESDAEEVAAKDAMNDNTQIVRNSENKGEGGQSRLAYEREFQSRAAKRGRAAQSFGRALGTQGRKRDLNSQSTKRSFGTQASKRVYGA